MNNTSIKTEVVRLRITPQLKQELKEMAEAEHRSMSNLLELLIIQAVSAKKKEEA